ncbi:DUF2220 family protein [Luteolibacter sp. SL250]|uniref:Wadjet anti-phage system protein JetD domain-containing protein n=1 Tax=Luteolibacter sp. SL250 TaxID=2995170 RepID=UPI0022704F2A|nr:Wadjet anti-phage system protein JetD domain-containing protein [Luteolibacter sp. SL250]WAC18338.1 DUF2220 family protein [Luteolibacter sp. SL250]
MNPTLSAFAEIYLRSSAARRGGKRDYTIDWEKFLLLAAVHDGDEREIAVQELLAAERRSGGMLVIERDRLGHEKFLKLKLDGGEQWLFAATGCASPSEERGKLADFFRRASDITVPHPYQEGWRAWCAGLAACASVGDPIPPFKRDDAAGNERFLAVLVAVLNWQEEALIQRASSRITGDSKQLGRWRARLETSIEAITSGEKTSLADFGIVDAPRSAWIHGPLELEFAGGRIDFGLLSAPTAISAIDLAAASFIRCRTRACVTVENECVFHELAAAKTGVLLIHTSFPGAATRLLLQWLPDDMEFHHFGDSDPAGFAILHDLCERTGRAFRPLMMRFREGMNNVLLTEGERKVITRLLSSSHLSGHCLLELDKMLAAGMKGDFEQESLPMQAVLDEIRAIFRD